jgi:hypothetical protein
MSGGGKASVDLQSGAQIYESSGGLPIPIDGPAPSVTPIVSVRQVYILLGYYVVLLTASITALCLLIWKEKNIDPKLLAFLGFVASGAIVGSILYQIRMLFRYYVKDNKFEPRWLAKYISAPFEAIGLSLAIFALLEGGSLMLGGKGLSIESEKTFTFFGLGALIGFGIREVVGWLGNLAKTTFPTDNKDP